jgi:hypothetical protein
VRLRLDGFPWTEYGELRGTVVSVASEAVGGSLRVECSLDPTSAPAIPLAHGLVGTLELEVDRLSPRRPAHPRRRPDPLTMPRAPRRRLAVEVIQTSGMDCGPAALKCLLEGFGLPIAYGRLREACQTDVDGTSIDTLEEIAVSLGLDAEQVMLPVDHLLLPEAAAVPAIVVTLTPGGMTHFVALWGAGAGWVQLMDPGSGRAFVREAAFLRRVFVHRKAVPADAFREWAGGDDFLAPLRRRLRDLGVGAEAEPWIAEALASADWRPIARLDAAVRMIAALVQAKGLDRGAEASGVLAQILGDTPRARRRRPCTS